MPKVNRIGFSIKYKLLILLVLLPIFTLVLYLTLAIRLFESDKIAYVFDSSAAVSRTLASQTSSEIRAFTSILKPILRGYQASTRKFNPMATSLFEQAPSIKAVLIEKINPNGLASIPTELTKEGIKWNPSILNQLRKVVCAKGFAFSAGKTELEIVNGLFYLASCENKIEIIAIGQAPDLLQAFGKKSVYSNYLLDTDEGQIMGPPNESAIDFKALPFLATLTKSTLAETTSNVTIPNGQELIVSAARIGIGNLLAISLVPKAIALSAVDALLWKSFLFLVCLISMAVIISVYASNKLTSTLRDLDQATGKIAEGDFNIHIGARSNDEVGRLATHFNQMAKEVSRLMSENISKARMEKELETAKTVQETLFPPANGQWGKFKVSGFYEPASECGGDWWHYGKVGEKIFLWIGDVTGHGAPAALVTSAAKSAATLIEEIPAITPAAALALLNKSIYQTSGGKLNMTFFLASLDPKLGTLTYCNASHNSPYLIRKSEAQFSKKDFLPLDENNNPRLGETLTTLYKETTIKLETGDQLFFYTDGILDLLDKQGQAWGERNFFKAIVSNLNQHLDPEACISGIHNSAETFRAGTALQDDVTYFLCSFGGTA